MTATVEQDAPVGELGSTLFPKAAEFADDFRAIGVDVHSVHSGTWWEAHDHLRNRANYHKDWQQFFRDNRALIEADPAAAGVKAFEYGRALAQKYGLAWI
ncbi:MAG: hypothetical protein R2762_08230 [Bryobacteraceae bacterium]